ncbi:MAG: MMPL family transporter [Alphaproteobacteria bacterium]
MFTSLLIAIVDFSRRFAKLVVGAMLLLSLIMGGYVAGHIKINTDINQLLSGDLVWRQREKQLESAFPQKVDNLIIVIDGNTAGDADAAASVLAQKLSAMPDKFTLVSQPDALPFFRSNGLLFLSEPELAATLDQIAQAQPMLGTTISDPSLRGFLGMIGMMMQGIQVGLTDPPQIQQIERTLAAVRDTINAANAGQDLPLDWAKMMPPSPNAARELRRFIVTKPVLDYSALEPGEAATKTIRKLATELGLTPQYGIHMRLTGPVALNDEEFASVAHGTGIATVLSGVLVIGLLFLAMRSWRIVLPIALTLCAGLIASTAFAAAAVGSLNLISVAFAVMFIGIAVDFGIQFGVRYRDQHHQPPDHAEALRRTAKVIALPLAMAAGSTALGFLSFIPTAYRGVSELGLIAGVGMIIAFVLNVTLLPALMTLTRPPAERQSIGYGGLAWLNNFLARQRRVIIPCIILLAVAALAIASQVRFDFDPLDLKDPKTESVSTMFEAMQDNDSDAYAAQLLEPTLQDAQQIGTTLSQLPEVDHVMTLASFVPDGQDKKLAMIADTTALLAPTFALPHQPAPTDEANLIAIRRASAILHQTDDKLPGAQTLADALDRLAAHYTPEKLKRAQDNIIGPLQAKVTEIQNMVHGHRVTFSDIPPELKRDWVTPDGQALVEIFPKRGDDNNPRDLKMLTRFIDAVQKLEPNVSGTPVSIRESGRTIISAFVHAGIYAVLSIALLSFIVLRRPRDVGLMLAPLVIAGALTLATITLIHLPLDFANIIALPLLLSLGVSYAVYFVFYMRTGRRDFLQSSMARAVLFSAATVLVAFSSLCFSAHPGTHGMGELLTIALLYSLVCTFLMLPVLLAPKGRDKP